MAFTKAQVRTIVRDEVRRIAEQPNVTQATRYWEDLRWNKRARRRVLRPVREKIKDGGEGLRGINASDLEKDVAVSNTSGRIWTALLMWRNSQP